MVDEAIATDGDLRRICDLSGVTIATAQHYASLLSHPALASPDAGSSIGEAMPSRVNQTTGSP
jgi:hypothetical protein